MIPQGRAAAFRAIHWQTSGFIDDERFAVFEENRDFDCRYSGPLKGERFRVSLAVLAARDQPCSEQSAHRIAQLKPAGKIIKRQFRLFRAAFFDQIFAQNTW